MYDKVTLRFEDGGRPLARHRLAFPLQVHEGKFSLKEARCEVMRRTVMVARLFGPDGEDVLQPLYDAKVVYCEDGEASVAGLEVDTLSRKFTAQAWHVLLAGARA